LLQGIDLIVHCASIHPWKKYTDQQYVDANIKGTWVLYATAAEVGIKKVLLTSSIAANAMGGVPMADWPIDEAVHYTPRDIYSFTKFCQEENARSLAVRQQVRTFALRPPAFMPADELQSVFRRTGCFTLVDDIASAHVAAVRVMADEARLAKLGWFEAFYITNDLPYTRADVALLNGAPNPRPLVQKYWPEAYEWLVAHGYEGAWLPAIYDNSKAKRLLGWQPVHNFPEAYRAYRARHPGA
jgi:nucleoside-diphosphate-sugar epimerase